MAAGSEELLMKGTLHGNIAGITRREWALFYLELTTRHMHVFEGHEDPNAARKHLRSLEIKNTDSVVPERPLKFTLARADGSNSRFKCDSEYLKQRWISALKKAIERRSSASGMGLRVKPKLAVHQPLPQLPPFGPDSGGSGFNDSSCGSVNVRLSKMSMISNDSGLGISDNGQVCTDRQHHSGGETHQRPSLRIDKTKTCSDSAMFDMREELDNHQWFWGDMNRADSETKMKEEGEIGNFAIRVNATGHYVMTFWRSDGIHHHKIIHQVGIYRFEKTAVKAEGSSLVDLLDNYMKNCIDKKIVPFGGALHLVYDEAWNPPEIDHEQLQRNLKARDGIDHRRRFLQKVLQPPVSPQPDSQSKNPRKKGKEYEVVPSTSDVRENEFTQTLPSPSKFSYSDGIAPGHVSPGATAAKPATSSHEGKKKPLPAPPVKKPSIEKERGGDPNKLATNDKRNNPLPPTPPESSPTPGGASNSKMGRPRPTPRISSGKAAVNTPPLSPSQTEQHSSETSLSPPLQEQAVYENTSFPDPRGGARGRGKKKKTPVPPPKSKSSSMPTGVQPPTPDSELDVGGQEVYENTAFGDSCESGDLYANIPVRQQKGSKVHNGHHKQPGAPYQNIAHDGSHAPDSGTAYQNVQFSGRGHRRKQ